MILRDSTPSATFPADSLERMSRLAESFPTLAHAPGVRPFEPSKLLRWLRDTPPGSGGRHAARFVLHLWNPGLIGARPFDIAAALGAWDDAHRDAFLSWAARPWFP